MYQLTCTVELKVVFKTVIGRRHTGVVTCVCMDRDGVHLVTGSEDTTAVVWQLQDTLASQGQSLKVVQVRKIIPEMFNFISINIKSFDLT